MKQLLLTLLGVGMLLQISFSQNVFINEVNYKSSSPGGSGVEIAGEAGESLEGWSIVFYSKNGRVTYTENIGSISIPDHENGYGSIWFDVEQSRSSSGVALVNPNGESTSFSSYGGYGGGIFLLPIIITAIEGPANGLTSTNIGTQLFPGSSLELIGTGIELLDFIWALPLGSTRGQVNTLQFFLGSILLENPNVLPETATLDNGSSVESPTNQNIQSVNLYPNPANNQLQVQLPGEVGETGILEVFDLYGHKIKTIRLEAGERQAQVELSGLPAGKYLLMVTLDQEAPISNFFSKQ